MNDEIAESPKEYLRQMMSSFSERQWSAGWCSGLEFLLWQKIRQCSADLTIRELADLNFYAGLAGGWWMWNHDHKQAVFIKMNKWVKLFAAHQEQTNLQ